MLTTNSRINKNLTLLGSANRDEEYVTRKEVAQAVVVIADILKFQTINDRNTAPWGTPPYPPLTNGLECWTYNPVSLWQYFNGNWTPISAIMNGVPEAPNDGNPYWRQSLDWRMAQSGGGGSGGGFISKPPGVNRYLNIPYNELSMVYLTNAGSTEFFQVNNGRLLGVTLTGDRMSVTNAIATPSGASGVILQVDFQNNVTQCKTDNDNITWSNTPLAGTNVPLNYERYQRDYKLVPDNWVVIPKSNDIYTVRLTGPKSFEELVVSPTSTTHLEGMVQGLQNSGTRLTTNGRVRQTVGANAAWYIPCTVPNPNITVTCETVQVEGFAQINRVTFTPSLPSTATLPQENLTITYPTQGLNFVETMGPYIRIQGITQLWAENMTGGMQHLTISPIEVVEHSRWGDTPNDPLPLQLNTYWKDTNNDVYLQTNTPAALVTLSGDVVQVTEVTSVPGTATLHEAARQTDNTTGVRTVKVDPTTANVIAFDMNYNRSYIIEVQCADFSAEVLVVPPSGGVQGCVYGLNRSYVAPRPNVPHLESVFTRQVFTNQADSTFGQFPISQECIALGKPITVKLKSWAPGRITGYQSANYPQPDRLNPYLPATTTTGWILVDNITYPDLNYIDLYNVSTLSGLRTNGITINGVHSPPFKSGGNMDVMNAQGYPIGRITWQGTSTSGTHIGESVQIQHPTSPEYDAQGNITWSPVFDTSPTYILDEGSILFNQVKLNDFFPLTSILGKQSGALADFSIDWMQHRTVPVLSYIIGRMSQIQTRNKSDLVTAINELEHDGYFNTDNPPPNPITGVQIWDDYNYIKALSFPGTTGWGYSIEFYDVPDPSPGVLPVQTHLRASLYADTSGLYMTVHGPDGMSSIGQVVACDSEGNILRDGTIYPVSDVLQVMNQNAFASGERVLYAHFGGNFPTGNTVEQGIEWTTRKLQVLFGNPNGLHTFANTLVDGINTTFDYLSKPIAVLYDGHLYYYDTLAQAQAGAGTVPQDKAQDCRLAGVSFNESQNLTGVNNLTIKGLSNYGVQNTRVSGGLHLSNSTNIKIDGVSYSGTSSLTFSGTEEHSVSIYNGDFTDTVTITNASTGELRLQFDNVGFAGLTILGAGPITLYMHNCWGEEISGTILVNNPNAFVYIYNSGDFTLNLQQGTVEARDTNFIGHGDQTAILQGSGDLRLENCNTYNTWTTSTDKLTLSGGTFNNNGSFFDTHNSILTTEAFTSSLHQEAAYIDVSRFTPANYSPIQTPIDATGASAGSNTVLGHLMGINVKLGQISGAVGAGLDAVTSLLLEHNYWGPGTWSQGERVYYGNQVYVNLTGAYNPGQPPNTDTTNWGIDPSTSPVGMAFEAYNTQIYANGYIWLAKQPGNVTSAIIAALQGSAGGADVTEDGITFISVKPQLPVTAPGTYLAFILPVGEIYFLDTRDLNILAGSYNTITQMATFELSTGGGTASVQIPSNLLVTSLLGNKVDKVTGMGLSANDFTNALLTKLNDLLSMGTPTDTGTTTMYGALNNRTPLIQPDFTNGADSSPWTAGTVFTGQAVTALIHSIVNKVTGIFSLFTGSSALSAIKLTNPRSFSVDAQQTSSSSFDGTGNMNIGVGNINFADNTANNNLIPTGTSNNLMQSLQWFRNNIKYLVNNMLTGSMGASTSAWS